MTVTHINSYFFSNSLHEVLVNKLHQAGIEQQVFIPLNRSEKQQTPEEKRNPKVSFEIVRCFNVFDRKVWPLKMLKVWRAFLKFFNPKNSDINHAHTLIVNGIIAYLAKKKFGTPYIVTIRNTDVNIFLKKSSFFRWLAMRILKDAEAFITLSPAYWNIQLKSVFSENQIRILKEKHITIPNGIDDYWSKNIFQPKDGKDSAEVLFVARLDRNKNLKKLIEACHLLIENGSKISLRVVGTGPLEKELKKTKTDFPVFFEGYVSEKEKLKNFYRNADVLVVPSITESFGLVYAEAITQGTPVVFTKGQGFDGFFENGVPGIAVNPNNANEIAGAIQQIMNDYSCFSQRAVKNARLFNWKTSVEKLIGIYYQNQKGSYEKDIVH